MRDMELVEMILDEEAATKEGVYAISIVDQPAIQSNFLVLRDAKAQTQKGIHIKFQEVDSEKRILTGMVLIPNKPIYRNDNGEEYYIHFSEQTIEKASQAFLKNGYQSASTLQHEVPINGLTVVESWIVKDPEKDKATALGMDGVVKGAWVVSVKVENEDIWNRYVKTGEVRGFSIEGFFSNGKRTKMEDQSIEVTAMAEACVNSIASTYELMYDTIARLTLLKDEGKIKAEETEFSESFIQELKDLTKVIDEFFGRELKVLE